jgi:transcriptional regulator with XRE-family HTH domain
VSNSSDKSKDPIGDILLSTLKEREVSVPKLAKITGIPKDRIYKWTQGSASPKFSDRELIEGWIATKDWKNFHAKSGSSKGMAIALDKESMAKEIAHLKAVVKAQAELLAKLAAAHYNRPVQDVMKELRENATLIMLDQEGQ